MQTELGRHLNENVRKYFIRPIFSLFMKTPLEGAQTQIKLAVDPDLESTTGKYFCHCCEKLPSRAARDDDNAKWMYGKSLELVGLQAHN